MQDLIFCLTLGYTEEQFKRMTMRKLVALKTASVNLQRSMSPQKHDMMPI